MINWFEKNRIEPVRRTLRVVAQNWDKQALCAEIDARTDDILRGIDQTITELKAVREFIEKNREHVDAA